MVPNIPIKVVNVPTDVRDKLAKASQVSQQGLNSKAFVASTSNVRAVLSDDKSKVTASQAVGEGWEMVASWKVNDRMWDVVESHLLECMQVQDTLFTCFALVHPRNFEGCIWDARQHAQEHAQPGLLLDYEYMAYEQYLRRRTVLYVCRNWPQYEQLVRAEHGPGIASAADYFQLMMYKYSNTGLLTEALALCDIFGCGADIVDAESGKIYNLFPRNTPDTSGRVALLRLDGCCHVLLPSSATDVHLPAVMSMSPEMVHGAQAQPMMISRSVAVGVFGYGDDRLGSVLPPVCLAMPPRPLQEAALTSKPQPWSGDPDAGMSSFAFGDYIGLGSADLQYSDNSSSDDDQGQGSSSSSSSGDGSSSELSDSVSTHSASRGSIARDIPVLTIPLADGATAIARFMASAFFEFDNTCWQCGRVLPVFVHLFEGRPEACSCTSRQCSGCVLHGQPTFGCTAAGFIAG